MLAHTFLVCHTIIVNRKQGILEMTLTENQILDIVKNKKISKCSKEHKAQVMAFMFGDEYMASSDKGAKRKYKE